MPLFRQRGRLGRSEVLDPAAADPYIRDANFRLRLNWAAKFDVVEWWHRLQGRMMDRYFRVDDAVDRHPAYARTPAAESARITSDLSDSARGSGDGRDGR